MWLDQIHATIATQRFPGLLKLPPNNKYLVVTSLQYKLRTRPVTFSDNIVILENSVKLRQHKHQPQNVKLQQEWFGDVWGADGSSSPSTCLNANLALHWGMPTWFWMMGWLQTASNLFDDISCGGKNRESLESCANTLEMALLMRCSNTIGRTQTGNHRKSIAKSTHPNTWFHQQISTRRPMPSQNNTFRAIRHKDPPW